MPLAIGTATLADLYIGNTPVQAAYAGSTLVWTRAPLAVSVMPTIITGDYEQATATATGGSGSYTWQWTRIGGSAHITADFPTAASTTFHRAGTGTASATFACTVNDGAGNATSNPVSVSIGGDTGGIIDP